VLEGARDGLWGFRDPAEGRAAIERYRAENRAGPPPAAPVPAEPAATDAS
jgi:hypothetical protein